MCRSHHNSHTVIVTDLWLQEASSATSVACLAQGNDEYWSLVSTVLAKPQYCIGFKLGKSLQQYPVSSAVCLPICNCIFLDSVCIQKRCESQCKGSVTFLSIRLHQERRGQWLIFPEVSSLSSLHKVPTVLKNPEFRHLICQALINLEMDISAE